MNRWVDSFQLTKCEYALRLFGLIQTSKQNWLPVLNKSELQKPLASFFVADESRDALCARLSGGSPWVNETQGIRAKLPYWSSSRIENRNLHIQRRGNMRTLSLRTNVCNCIRMMFHAWHHVVTYAHKKGSTRTGPSAFELVHCTWWSRGVVNISACDVARFAFICGPLPVLATN